MEKTTTRSSMKRAAAIREELDRLENLRRSDGTFGALYNILTGTDPDKAAAMWIDEEGVEQTRSFAAFDRHVRAAAALFRRSIGEENQGRFAALKMGNQYLWPVAFWGLLMAGYKPLLLDANITEQVFGSLMAASGAVVLVGNADQAGSFPTITPAEIDAAAADQGDSFPPRFSDEIALCTSGTTNDAKVYVFGEGAIVKETLGVIPKITECPRLVQDVRDPVRHLAFLPMHHILGFMVHCILFPVVGKTVVYLKDRAPQTIRETCLRFHVTNLIVVPLLLNNLTKGLWKKVRQDGGGKVVLLKTLFALSNGAQALLPRRGPDIAGHLVKSVQSKLLGNSIRTVLVGGSHIPKKTLRTVNALGYYPIPGYGMTEVGLTSFETRPQARYRKGGCTGTPITGISYRTLDENDRPAPVGELQIRGDSIHKARLIDGVRRPPDYGEDGWFRSGDICRLEKGCLYIDGRLKEIILNESGENIYPDELEDVFDAISGVDQLCILSLANGTPYGDTSLVFQLPENSVDAAAVATVAAEVSAVNAQLPVFKRVRRLFVAAQPLPLANGIKVRRQKLQEWLGTGAFDARPVDMASGALGATGGDAPSAAGIDASDVETAAMREIRREVVNCFAAVLSMEPGEIGIHKRFIEDLGGDSLDSLNLLVRVETAFGLMVDEREYRGCATVDDITRLIWRKRMGQPSKPLPLNRVEVTPITRFTDSREHHAFQERVRDMSHMPHPYFIRHDSVLTDVSTIDGREVLNFASYNYICMSGREETVRAACRTAELYGTSASGSRLLAGEKGLYCELEEEIAAWKHTEAALVLVSGHATNVTFVGNFCNENDLILYDALSHNSILQGCAMSLATCRAFPHNDVAALEEVLQMSRKGFEKVLLVVEGVYSMDGDIAPIDEFVRLKKAYGLILMVDEAHSACV
ncbi:MAG: aminotransferase class I/II-fold pyridoxal phosphate-dependent enzyme, partial [Oscillospiraceae bacterium]|nr:aminotransferase class I/II-fold pyridoxal phosphate-dependent enzyme [Oscillospiraceae bacterium]